MVSFAGWNSSWTKSLTAHPNLWTVLLEFEDKEAWSTKVYTQSSFVVGGESDVGAAVGARKTSGEVKRLNLQSLAKDFPTIRRRDFLCRLVTVMHTIF